MEIKQVKVYEFKELLPEVQEKVLNHLCGLNTEFDWWKFIYEDTEQVGIKITAFDLDRGSYCNGDFITSPLDCANLILKNHGETCETFKTVKQYIKALKSKNEDKQQEAEEDFYKAIMEDYRILLQKEYEYLTSEEATKEIIEANDYRFYENGKIFCN